MSSLFEVLVTCDSNNTLWTCSIWDPHTGSSLMTYKGGGTAEFKTLCFIGNDYIAAVEKCKPILHVWPLNSHNTVQGLRFVLPGKASTFAVTHDGAYCIAGIDEKMYLWQMTSGNLLTVINRHYQKVVIVKFTNDGRYFVSAAEDGMVMVWSLVTVAAHPEVDLVSQTTAGQYDPEHIFSDHSLPVTDLYISKTGIHGRLCTISMDRTCKIYDLSSGDLLLNIVFDVPLSCITMDVLELSVFVGTTEGKILQFSLTNPPRSRDFLINELDNIQWPMFISHTKTVTCLSVSLDGETLMSGSIDEQVILWHIHSKQVIRTIRHKGPVTNAFFTCNYPAIFQQDFTPHIILHSLSRSLETDEDNDLEMEILVKKRIEFWPESSHEISENSVLSKEPQNEFGQKNTKLHDEMNNLRKINAELYEFSIHKALNSVINTSNINKKKKHK